MSPFSVDEGFSWKGAMSRTIGYDTTLSTFCLTVVDVVQVKNLIYVIYRHPNDVIVIGIPLHKVAKNDRC